MKTIILGFALGTLTLATATADPDDAAYNAARCSAFEAVAFSDVKSVSVAKLDGSKKLGMSSIFVGTFHDYRVVSKWRKLDSVMAEKFAALLKEPIDAKIAAYRSAGDQTLLELDSFCIPTPGYAVKIEADRGSRDFLICLECGEIYAFGDGVKGVGFRVESTLIAKLKKSYGEQLGN